MILGVEAGELATKLRANDDLAVDLGMKVATWLVASKVQHSIEVGTMIDRSKIAQALAKAIAYKLCGKQKEAELWAQNLICYLECADILKK